MAEWRLDILDTVWFERQSNFYFQGPRESEGTHFVPLYFGLIQFAMISAVLYSKRYLTERNFKYKLHFFQLAQFQSDEDELGYVHARQIAGEVKVTDVS